MDDESETVAEMLARHDRQREERERRQRQRAKLMPWVVACLYAGVPLLGLVVWLVSSHFDAQAYNRATGSNVSTWDAMWVELRVQAGAR